MPWQKIKVQDPQGPASSIQFRILGSQGPASSIHFRILGSQGPMSSIHFRILGFLGPTSRIPFRIQGSQGPTSGINFRIQGPRHNGVLRHNTILRSWVSRVPRQKGRTRSKIHQGPRPWTQRTQDLEPFWNLGTSLVVISGHTRTRHYWRSTGCGSPTFPGVIF